MIDHPAFLPRRTLTVLTTLFCLPNLLLARCRGDGHYLIENAILSKDGQSHYERHLRNRSGLIIARQLVNTSHDFSATDRTGFHLHTFNPKAIMPANSLVNSSAINLYLDLMKRCLTNCIYGPEEVVELPSQQYLQAFLIDFCKAQHIRVVQAKPFDKKVRAEGRDWPPHALTMVGLKRLDNLQYCVEEVLAGNVAGDFIETGVWRGGAAILMRAILKAHGDNQRRVWVADSFAGLPPPNAEKYPHDAGDIHHTFRELVVSLEQVQHNFQRFDLLDDQVVFLEGWFRDTLPQAPVGQLAVIRLDGDMYESTMDALTHLYPKLSIGGYLIIDDYGCIPACRQAVHNYRQAHCIREPIHLVDWTGAYWQRTEAELLDTLAA